MRTVLRCGLLLGLLVGVGALIAACGGSDNKGTSSSSSSGDSGGSASATVNATLSEFSITVDKASAAAGKITFNAKNNGTVPHELVVIKTDLAPDQLPVANGVVDASKVTSSGEIEQFDAGKTQSGTFTLTSGKYVLICNVPAHYQAGMHIAFTVQ